MPYLCDISGVVATLVCFSLPYVVVVDNGLFSLQAEHLQSLILGFTLFTQEPSNFPPSAIHFYCPQSLSHDFL